MGSLSGWTPNPMTSVHDRDTQTAEERPCEDRGRARSGAATGPGTAGAARSWRHKAQSLPDPMPRSWTAGLQSGERTHSCCFEPFSLWILVAGAPGNESTPQPMAPTPPESVCS